MPVVIRNMSESDLPFCLSLSREMQWPHRSEDWKQASDLGKGVIASLNGRAAGTGMIWNWGPHLSNIGLVIVSSEFQRCGIGKEIISALVNKATSPVIRLCATRAGEPLYRSSDFRPVGICRQFQTRALIPALTVPSSVRLATINDLDMLAEFDKRATLGADRRRLISMQLENAKIAVLQDVGEHISGYAACRRFGRGYVIGPIICNHTEAAKALVSWFSVLLAGQFVRIDCPGRVDQHFFSWLQQSGMNEVDSPIMMEKGQSVTPYTDTAIFGFASQAMG
jgi:hypothetical protein